MVVVVVAVEVLFVVAELLHEVEHELGRGRVKAGVDLAEDELVDLELVAKRLTQPPDLVGDLPDPVVVNNELARLVERCSR